MSLETAARRHDSATVPRYRQILAFARRTAREYLRNRNALFWGLLMPIGWYLLFGIAVSSAPSSPTGRATMAVAFGIFGAFTVSLVLFTTSLSNDLTERRYRKLRSLPISPLADFLGRFLGAVGVAGISFLLVLSIGAITGAGYELQGIHSIPIITVAFVLFCLVGTGMAVLVASTISEGEYVLAVSNLLLLGLFFITGYNGITPEIAPDPLPQYVNLVPNALATRLSIYHLTGTTANPSTLSPPPLPTDLLYLVLLVVYAVVLCGLATIVLHRRVYVADGGE